MSAPLPTDLDPLDTIMSACLLLRKEMIDLGEWEHIVAQASKRVAKDYAPKRVDNVVKKGGRYG